MILDLALYGTLLAVAYGVYRFVKFAVTDCD
jgi:hypothetical protein